MWDYMWMSSHSQHKQFVCFDAYEFLFSEVDIILEVVFMKCSLHIVGGKMECRDVLYFRTSNSKSWHIVSSRTVTFSLHLCTAVLNWDSGRLLAVLLWPSSCHLFWVTFSSDVCSLKFKSRWRHFTSVLVFCTASISIFPGIMAIKDMSF